MEVTSLIEIWRYLRWLPRFVLRKIFTKERLSDLVLIDVRARHESVRVQISEVSRYDVYFQIINMSPFDIFLDRSSIRFVFGGVEVQKDFIKETSIAAGAVVELHIDGQIEAGSAKTIAKLYKSNSSQITMYCSFGCSLHNFSKDQIVLAGLNVNYFVQGQVA